MHYMYLYICSMHNNVYSKNIILYHIIKHFNNSNNNELYDMQKSYYTIYMKLYDKIKKI